MDLLKNMNRALHYIEENLTNDINFREVVKLALCSEYHFKRMFSFLAGISQNTFAEEDLLLQHSNLKIRT
jgi:AraC family transcriptional regulator